MDNQIKELSKKNTGRRLLKRLLAFVCAAVLLFTMNGLKRHADTLERRPACGLQAHVHTDACYDDAGNAVCGMVEHVHTDACYQTRPTAVVKDADSPVEEVELELGAGADEPSAESVVAEPEAGEDENVYILGEAARLTQIVEATELNVDLDQIVAVGAIENDESQIGLVRVDALEEDWLVTASRDFDEAELALVLDTDILVVKLVGGRAPLEEPVAEEQAVAFEAAEEQVAEEDAEESVEEQGEEQPTVEESTEEQPAVEEAIDEQPIIDESAEDQLIAEEPVEEQAEEQPGTAESTEEQTEEERTAEEPVEEQDKEQAATEEPFEEQPTVEEPIEDQSAAEEPIEEQGDDQPAVEESTEEQPAAEESAEAQGEDQSEDNNEVTEEQGENVEDRQPEEQNDSVEEASEERDEEAEQQPEDQDEDTEDQQPDEQSDSVEDRSDEQVESTEDQQSEEQNDSVEEASEERDEEAEQQSEGQYEDTEDQRPDEQSETVEEASNERDEQAEQQPEDQDENAENQRPDEQSESVEEQPEERDEEAEQQHEDQDEDAEDQQPEEQSDSVEERSDEQVESTEDQQPDEQSESVEEQSEEQGEDADQQPAEELSEEEQPDESGDVSEGAGEDQTDEQQPEAQTVPVITITIDLADVDTYPLSLNEMITAAALMEEQGGDKEQPEDDAAEPERTIEYDDAVLEIIEAEGDYLITPVQDFESTQIIVSNGSRYELTLVNCVLASEEGEEEQEEQIAPVYTATIDLADVETYPLSMNEMLTAAVPEEGPLEEQAEGQAEEEHEEQREEPRLTLAIDYDESLLEIVGSDDDCLITPIQSFESTRIIVTNGSIYELTLVNCVLRTEEESPAYPAQDFEARTEYVKVSVSAPEGAFPEGTTMSVADVEDEQTISDIEQTVSEDFVEVKRVHAVDITFNDADGIEIEPMVPISVVITVAEIEEQQDAVVVHVDNEGATEVVESQSEAPAGETEVTVEMPASDTVTAEETRDEEKREEQTDQAEESRAFSADSFSVYAVVVTETIETKYIDDAGETWSISVGFTKAANIPANATLAVTEVGSGDYLPEAEAVLEGGKRVTMARFFDITILDEDGEEVQPEAPVTVNISLDNAEVESIEAADHVIDNGDPVAVAMHFEQIDESISVDVEETTETEAEVVFTAESFSVWGVVYTVDFYYGDYEYHLPGEGYITLSALFEKLEIEADAALATEVTFTDPTLLAVVKVNEDIALSQVMAELGLDEAPVAEVEAELGKDQESSEVFEEEETILCGPDWLLVSLAPFDTEEKLTVSMEDGTNFEIKVEDDQNTQYHLRVNDRSRGYFEPYLTADRVQNPEYNNGLLVKIDYEKSKPGNAKILAVTDSRYVKTLCVEGGDVNLVNRDGVPTWQFDRNSYGDGQTYISYFAPSDAKLIIVEEIEDKNTVALSDISVTGNGYRYPESNTSYPRFLYSTDNTVLTAAAGKWPYFFKGWYADGECISTSNAFDVSTVTEDIILTPVYEPVYRYYLKANEEGKGLFYVPFDGWTDEKMSYGPDDQKTDSWKRWGRNLPTEIVPNEGLTSFALPVYTGTPENSGYEFVYWLRDDGATPITSGTELCGFKNGSGAVRDHYNEMTRDTTFVAFYKPKNDYIVRLNWSAEGGSTGESSTIALRTVHDDITNKDIFWYHYAFADNATIVAKPTYDETNADNRWAFVGWFHNGTELISDQATLNLREYYRNIINSGETPRDLNLTPVFKRIDPHFHVWFDGTNGVGGGGNPANNTFYTRITSKNDIIGSTSEYQQIDKVDANTANPYATITLPSTAVSPQGVGQNKFALQGWYCVYPGVCEAIEGQTEMTSGQCYKPGTKVKITGDAVFYADWFPVDSDYSVSVKTSIEPKNLDTSRFITTRVFDYNNLFNMNSIYLNQGQSVIPTADADGNWMNYNKEYWYMNGNPDDFIFLSTVSGQGRSLNPFGRDYKNQNREISTNGGYYTGTRTTGLLTSNLKNRLFGTSDGLGKRYLGTGNMLYSYNSDTGYYYYDSDKNAASYNKAAQEFYVYNYTNKTNKSNGGDNTDFMPFNRGDATFTEGYGEPNYWFGMTSEISFFLPNAVSAANADNPVNFSDHDREMVYKFAGDDDVWVYVDGELVLDMGGVHGKIYGEINFSRGTWQIAQEGTERIWDGDEILSYANNGNLSQHGTIDLTEGDHTLTLYYLERGASQSNCAIYFNIAPRYGLRFIKQDEAGNSLGNIRFGIYTDPECTIAADLKNNSGTNINEFFDGSGDGMTHARNLVAGRTYYIKEIKAPDGYPDMSSHIIKLELDAHGKAKITPPADATWMVNISGLTTVPNEEGSYYLGKVNNEPDMYLLTVVNKNETSITASKTWAMLDGSTFVAVTGRNTDVNTNATAKIKLQRRVLAEAGTANAVQMGNHKVKLITRYFVDGNGSPSNRDTSGRKQVRAATYTVKDNNNLSFTLNAPSGSGIYSVVASSGNLVASGVSGSSGTLYINGGTGTKPTTGTYTLSGVQSDAVIYITFIGTGTPSAPSPDITNNIDGRFVVEDTAFNDAQTENNDGIVTLNSGNDWTTTWDNLLSSDANGKTYYYYVAEVGGSTANISESQFATSFISTTSSDGLSSGTIMVNNTLQSVRVMLRKRDAVKPNGKNVYLSGGKYELHIGSADGNLYIPPDNALDKPRTGSNGSMGANNGAELTGDSNGRFYTGYLPVGTYYLVETEAPEGYEPTTPRRIEVNESGISWDRDGNGTLVEAPLDSNGYYSLYLNNTVKKGSIQIQKLWKSESNYGLTRTSEGSDFVLDNNGKLYSNSDNGATAVLLSLGAVVDGAINSDVVDEVLNNPASHGLTDKVVTVNGHKYIRLEKTGTSWPALPITNLPLKHQFVQNDVGVSKDVWYFIEEYGYYDANNQLVLAANRADNWSVSYGFVNSVTNGTGKEETISGTTYTLVKPKESNPDTLTVTNGFTGGLEFTKKRTDTNTVLGGAVFQIIPNGAGDGNYITGADTMLTSGDDGKVTISGLPIGTYWMWEKTAPNGYQKTENLYCLMIGYPQTYMYLVNGENHTLASEVFNPPVGALKITKTVTVNGEAPAADDTYTNGTYLFSIDGLGSTSTAGIHKTVSITFVGGKATQYQIDSETAVTVAGVDNSWSVTVPDLTPGQYTITEQTPNNGTVLSEASRADGANAVNSDKVVTVEVVALDTTAAQTKAQANFTNTYYQVSVGIVKIDETKRDNQNPTRLTGAKFRLLKKGNNSEYAVYPATNDADYKGETVDSNGELTFANLSDGEYMIEETVMPAGYVKSVTNDIYFKVVNGVVTRTNSAGAAIERVDEHNKPIKVDDITYVKANYAATFTVGNTPGVALPSTGGPGTAVFYVGGAALLLTALALLIRKKARDE